MTVAIPKQAKDLRVDIYTDTGANVPDLGTLYIHCSTCLEEWEASFQGICTPKQYARQQVAWTGDGFQVWCTRHDLNVAHITFRAGRAAKEAKRKKVAR